MKRNGFTLVELLAVVVIMGIILIVVLPSVNKLQNQNKKKGYELYAESALRAAKLYVEDRKESFSSHYNWTTNCYIPITYNQLLSADLIKPYSDTRYNCTNLQIRVSQRKEKSYTFTYSLTCLDTKSGNSQVYSNSTHKGDIGICATK